MFSPRTSWFHRALLLAAASVGVLAPTSRAVPPPWTDDKSWSAFWNDAPWDASHLAFWPGVSAARPQTIAPAVNAVTSQTWLGDGGNGGNGTWSTAVDWSPATWVAGNVAVFGNTAGTVTVGTQTAGGLTFNVGGYTLQSGTLTLNSGSTLTTNGGTTTFAANLALAGTGGTTITKTGSGTLAILQTGGNSGLGTATSPATWTVTGGTKGGSGLFDSVLAITFGSTLGVAPSTATTQFTLDAGTLLFQNGTADNTNLVGATRTVQINAAGGAINDTNGYNDTLNGAVVNNAGSGSSLYLSNKSATLTLAGLISGGGSVTWNGAGTLALTAANTFSGGLTINTGVVSFVTDGNLGSGTLSLNGGTLLSAQTAGVTMTRTINVGANGGTLALNGKVPTNSANKITLGTAGQLTGSGALTLANNGLLSIGAANTGFSGAWTLNGGVLELTNNKGAGTGGITINSGAELTTLGSQITNALTLNGGTVSWDYYNGSGDYQGPVTLQAGGGTVSLVSFYSGGTAISGTISGSISGAGALSTSNVGPGATSSGGTLTLSGNNSYTGGTTVGTGTTILLGSTTALGASTGPLSVSGSLNFNGYSPSVGALTLAGTTATGPSSSASVGTTSGATLIYTFGSASVETLSVASGASFSGTTDLMLNTAGLTTLGTYSLITSRNGTLTGAWEFAGAENMTSPVTSLLVRNPAGNAYDPSGYYRLTLNNTGGTLQAVASNNVPSKVLTIFPFGSSITAGQSNQSPYNGGGYRTGLYLDLVNDGRFIPNYVGSSTNLTSNNANEGNLLTIANQLANEGHPGWTTLQMLANLNMTNGDPGANGGYWLKPGNGENPNYITVNIGGNDAVYALQNNLDPATYMAGAAQRLDAIVSEFNTLRPGVATVLSSIAFRNDGTPAGKFSLNAVDPYYNPAIQGVVFNHVLAGQNVSFLDLRNIMNYPADISSDGIHPTQAGYDKMADAWYQALVYGQAYWKGGQGGAWNTVNGSATNFAFDAGLTTDRGRGLNDAATNQNFIYPDVYFSSNTAALNTTLGADTTVRSLNFTGGATGPVTIGAGNTLTIGAVDTSTTLGATYTTQNSGGITVAAGSGAHTVAADIMLGADQTWGNVSSNNLAVSGAIGGAHNLAFVGSYTVYQPGTYTANGTNYQGASFTTTAQTVQGAGGGFVLSGASNYTGTTTIGTVTVTLDNAGSTAPRLAGTSGIVLNPGGTLLLASSAGVSTDRINNNATLTMAGGTFNTAGFSEGTVNGSGAPVQGLGALTLTATSVLDLGAGASIVTFANSSAATWTAGTQLRVYDWSGSTAGGGTDRVFFGGDLTGLTSTQLSQVAFYSDMGSTFLGYGGILANGEIVPVPEPATVFGGLLLVGVAGWRGRKAWRASFPAKGKLAPVETP